MDDSNNRPTRIGQVAVSVHDLNRAVAFYRDVVGLEYLFEIPNAAFFRAGETRLMLALPEGTSSSGGVASILYFDVADLSAAHRSMVAKGVSFEGEPHLIARMPDHDLWMAFFRDSEGHLMALMSEVRNAHSPPA